MEAALSHPFILGFGLVAMALCVALTALVVLPLLPERQKTGLRSVFQVAQGRTVLIFDGERLVDATPAARGLMDPRAPPDHAFSDLLHRLETMFPGLAQRADGLGREGSFVLCSHASIEPPVVLRAELLGGLTRISLLDHEEDASTGGREATSEILMRAELAALRETQGQAPLPIWRENPNRQIIWANGAFIECVAASLPPDQELVWPLPAVLRPDDSLPARDDGSQVVTLATRQGLRNYEILSLAHGEDRLYWALPADRRIRAEENLHNFTRTLTNTFAQLPIGLAIFDKERRLQIFNPALTDLTGLAIDMLVAQPTLGSMLDALRERGRIPEPRDYRSWRQQLVRMEEAASSGLFQDTWSLPSGQTWRITGHPHPDGALAFLVEDISHEIMRIRRFRADLELGQSVMDAMHDAIIVFGQDGAVSMANAAAHALWGETLGLGAQPKGEPSIFALWRARSSPTPLWDELWTMIRSFEPPPAVTRELRLSDGRSVSCRVAPMPNRATLVAFSLQGSDPQLQVPRQSSKSPRSEHRANITDHRATG